MAVETFLLAAGLGTRMRPYTEHMAKPCLPFLGVPLVGYGMYLSQFSGYKNILMNTHAHAEHMRACALNLAAGGISLSFSHEADKPLGSGGAIHTARDILGKGTFFFAMNADEVFIPDRRDIFRQMKETYDRHDPLAVLLVSDDPKLVSRFNPLWLDHEDRVIGIGRDAAPPPNTRPVHYMGLKIFNTELLRHLPPGESNIFRDTLIPLTKKGFIARAVVTSCPWWETGDFSSFFSSLKEAMSLIVLGGDQGFFKDVAEWAGRDMNFHMHQRGEDVVFIHKTSDVDLQQIKGSAYIGKNVRVDKSVTVENCVINDNCRVSTSLTSGMYFEDSL